MTKPIHINKAAGILIKERQLLVSRAKNKSFFISPGGRLRAHETPEQALIRELKEEFNIDVTEKNLKRFGAYEADAVDRENTRVHMDVFMVTEWSGEPKPNAEVEKIRWITADIPRDIKLGTIFEHKVIPQLKEQNLID